MAATSSARAERTSQGLNEDLHPIPAAAFFDAALMPERWPALLERFLGQIGQTAAALSGQSRSDMTGPFFSWGLAQDRIAIFMRDYAHSQHNLALTVFQKAPLGVATRWHDLVDPIEAEKLPISRDLIMPMGLEKQFAVNLFWEGDYGALLSVLGPPNPDPVSQATLDHATHACRYMAPAFEMTCRMAIAERENRVLWDAFSTLGLGLMIRSDAGRVTRMNAVAESLLGGKAQRLETAGASAQALTGGLAKNAALLTDGLARPVLALQLPLCTSHIGLWNDDASFLVVLVELDRDAPYITTILKSVFAATPRQVEVAQLLLDGASSPDIAAQLGISASTVDTHIDRLCLQTGTANRTMLRNWMMQLRSIV